MAPPFRNADDAGSGSNEEPPSIEDAIESLAAAAKRLPLLIFHRSARASDAARYIRLGAWDAVSTPEEVAAMVENIPDARGGSGQSGWRSMLVGTSPAMVRAAEVINLVAKRSSTVLITGETGTGKELLARAVHQASPRAALPMIAVNVAALPENLLEAELFGHVKGAFTGALQQRQGRFEQANKSTLFLDEIGDLPLDVQTKLLRFLQEREFQRIGSSETVRVDVRMIAATNVDLHQKVREGAFREDLYYRLNVVPLAAPPLRERPGDIPLLAEHFVEKICRRESIPPRRLTPEVLSRLTRHEWPGNVRQLENALESAVALSGDREILYPSDFAVLAASRPVQPPPAWGTLPEYGLDFDRTVGGIERQIIEEALRRTGGNKTAAAEMLGLKRTTLSAKLKSFGAGAG